MIEKIIKLKEKFELFSNSKVDLVIGDPMPDGYYNMIIEESGLDVSLIFQSVFNEFEFIQFKAYISDQIISEINISGLMMSFNNVAQEHYIHAFDEFGEDFKVFARQFYPFDVYEESSDAVTLIVLKIVNNKHSELWIWNNSGPKYKLKFKSIEAYLEAGVQCNFTVFWQYFYIDIDSLDFNDSFTSEWIASSYSGAISRMETTLANMKEYFPDEDWSYQQNELERVKNL